MRRPSLQVAWWAVVIVGAAVTASADGTPDHRRLARALLAPLIGDNADTLKVCAAGPARTDGAWIVNARAVPAGRAEPQHFLAVLDYGHHRVLQVSRFPLVAPCEAGSSSVERAEAFARRHFARWVDGRTRPTGSGRAPGLFRWTTPSSGGAEDAVCGVTVDQESGAIVAFYQRLP